MAEAASSPDLKQAFTTHLRETQGHIRQLEQVFRQLGTEPERTYRSASPVPPLISKDRLAWPAGTSSA